MSAISSSTANAPQLDVSKLTKEDKIEMAILLKRQGILSITEAAKYCEIHTSTIMRSCKKEISSFRYTLAQALQCVPRSVLKTDEAAKKAIAAIEAGSYPQAKPAAPQSAPKKSTATKKVAPAAAQSAAKAEEPQLSKEDKIEIAALLRKEGLISKDTAQVYTRAGHETIAQRSKKELSDFRFTLLQALQHFPTGSLKTTFDAKRKIAATKAEKAGAAVLKKDSVATSLALDSSSIPASKKPNTQSDLPRDVLLDMCAVLIKHELLTTRATRAHYGVGNSKLQKHQKNIDSIRFTPQEALKNIPKEILRKDRFAQEKIAALTASILPASSSAAAAAAGPVVVTPIAKALPAHPESAQVAKDILSSLIARVTAAPKPAVAAAPAGTTASAAAAPSAPPSEPAALSENFVHYVNLYRGDEITLSVAAKRCGMEEDEFKLLSRKVPIGDRKAFERALAAMMPDRLAQLNCAAPAATVPPITAAPLPLPPLPPIPLPPPFPPPEPIGSLLFSSENGLNGQPLSNPLTSRFDYDAFGYK